MRALCSVSAVFLSFLTASGVAADQEGDDADQNRLRAQEFIDATPDADGIWEVADEGVRHIQSRMLCYLKVGLNTDLVELLVIPSPDLERGEDVACQYNDKSQEVAESSYTLYATKASDTDAMASMEVIVQVMRTRYPDSKPAGPIPVPSAQSEDGSQTKFGPMAAASNVTLDGQAMRTGVWYNHVNGWDIKLRVTYPEEDATQIELLAGFQWLLAAGDVRDN